MARLTSAQLQFLQEEGYLVVEGLLDPKQDLDPVISEYEAVLDRLADELYAQGRVKSAYADLPFSERFIRLCHDTNRFLSQHFDFCLPLKNIRADTPLWVGPAIFRMLRNERLLDALECIIGPEIYANPVQHVRLRMPEDRAMHDDQGSIIDGPTPWHQDNGVVLPEADETKMQTVWFPLTDAPIESGCLKILPRSHREGLRAHCPLLANGRLEIPEKQLPELEFKALPMKRGDVLFMHRLTCHSSFSNRTNKVRWSMDLRYHPVGQATGRGAFPGFVARSRAHPESELRDPEAWARMWHEARAVLAAKEDQGRFHRWDAKAAVCA